MDAEGDWNFESRPALAERRYVYPDWPIRQVTTWNICTGSARPVGTSLADEQLEIALHESAALTASRVEGNASLIQGAAARIEVAANMLQ